MKKKAGMNKHQKAVYRVGEPQVGREQIAELLEMSCSTDADDRLVAAENLCPCHVRTRIPAVWDALYRLMEDADPRIRQAAWHTIEDGGKPGDEEGMARLERLCDAETHPKVRNFAEHTLRKIGNNRRERERMLLHVAGLPPVRQRGKCDFCGESNVFVELDTHTMIPTNGSMPRAALMCEQCAKTF